MKKFLKYSAILLASLITIAFMHFEFGLFTRYNYFTAKYDIYKGNTGFVSYGLMGFNAEAEKAVYSKYEIHTSSLGCLINWDDSKGGVECYNYVKRNYIKNKYGTNIFERIEKEIVKYDDSLSKVSSEDKVIDLITKLKIVQDRIKLVDSLTNHKRRISPTSFIKDSIKMIYLVKVWEDNGVSFTTHYNFLIDSKKMIILNPSGKLEEY